jgi:colicin import membrane protein
MSAVKNNSIGSPYRVPPEPSRLPAIALAVTVHALLLAFLWIGVNWQNHQPVQVEAEVWDMKVQAAAPPPQPPVQETEPEPEPEPAPAPKVVQQPVEPPAPAPDIRLEREKQRKEQLRREQQERERELAEQKEAKARELAEKKAKDEALKKEQAKKEDAERKARELAEKKDAEKKDKADKLAKAKADAASKARVESQRKQELQRMMDQAGTGTNGAAARSTAPRMDSGYLAAITAKIKSSTIYAGSNDEPGNPTVTFRVDQLPTGEIISVRKVKSSGVPAFDDAVERGISKSSPLPKKKDGTVERSLEVFFHLKDLN